MAIFEKNVEQMVWTTRDAAAVATESGGAATTSDETVAMAGDEMVVTVG